MSTSTQNYSAMPPLARDPTGTIAPQNGMAEGSLCYTDGPEGAPKRTFRRASS